MRPRIRTLKPEFWSDETICSLPRDVRLTAIALISAADDRGRLEYSAAAIRGYAFPRDRLTDRRVQGWIERLVAAGVALNYTPDSFPWAYLWLPKFWRHQVINRPSESLLPAHPDDPYGALPVVVALAKFREDSLSDSLSPHPSRVGARSVPVVGVNQSPSEKTEVDARALFEYWQSRCSHPGAKPTRDRLVKVRARLAEGYTAEQVRLAIDGAARGAFVNEQGRRFDDLELICRSGSKLESFIDRATSNGNGRSARPAQARRNALIQHD